mmetsp:Transcript_24076/g.66992  ORF Transcript_24076/g.66992 Transcript_24076/m.66992 type:complete len:685 (+) Transcript_24076:97-2151(+)
MSFQELVNASAPEKYRQYYIKYNQLKDLVQELMANAKPQRSRLVSRDLIMDEQPVGTFQKMLRAELTKVNQFACVKHEDLFLSLRRLCEECKSLGRAPEEIDFMSRRIEGLGEEVVHLDTYVRLNYLGFTKITQKFDQCLGVSGSALFVAGLQGEAFCNVRFDDILILLGLCWARWRAAQQAEQSKDATWKPPESFIRNTAKYWVRPDKVTLLKTRIVKHLPYLLFGASTIDQERLLEPFALLDLDYESVDVQPAIGAYSGTLEESQLLSSVYFDSPDATCYQERIHREEGARLVRFRWYGENNWEPNKEIFVERKIHHEGWGGLSSAKERCIVPQSDIFEFMKGKLDIDDFFAKLAAEGMYSDKARKAMKGICHEVNNMIQEKHLQPILRTSYYRCAFQLSTSNEVRISLDTQMTLLNEFIQDGHPSKPWCHTSSDLLGADEVYRFPFAILEIKLQNVSETPHWLQQTLADIDAIQVHKFSKFQHGMAFLHPERVPILPHWHQDFSEWHRQKDSQTSKQTDQKLTAAQAQSLLCTQSGAEDVTVPQVRTQIAPTGRGHMLKDMENLDPKAIFASERTLLHYAEKGMYVGALAVALIHQQGPLQVAGGILSCATLLFYAWSFAEYLSRLSRIHSRAAVSKSTLLRLDWAHGPLIVGMLILLVLVLTGVSVIISIEPSSREGVQT